jgi:hypothetical protein
MYRAGESMTPPTGHGASDTGNEHEEDADE